MHRPRTLLPAIALASCAALAGLAFSYLRPNRLPAHATLAGDEVIYEADASGFWFWPCGRPVTTWPAIGGAAAVVHHVTTPDPGERWACLTEDVRAHANTLCMEHGIAWERCPLGGRLADWQVYAPHFEP